MADSGLPQLSAEEEALLAGDDEHFQPPDAFAAPLDDAPHFDCAALEREDEAIRQRTQQVMLALSAERIGPLAQGSQLPSLAAPMPAGHGGGGERGGGACGGA